MSRGKSTAEEKYHLANEKRKDDDISHQRSMRQLGSLLSNTRLKAKCTSMSIAEELMYVNELSSD